MIYVTMNFLQKIRINETDIIDSFILILFWGIFSTTN